MYETHEAPTATLTAAEQVVEQVNRRGEPTTVAQLVKDLKPLKKPAIETLVQDLIDRGELFVVNPQERTKRYWTGDLTVLIRERAEECLAAGPRGEREVVVAIKKALGKLASDKAIKTQLGELIARNRLHRHPGRGRTAGPLALEPYDPLATLTLNPATVKDLRARFEKMRDNVSVEAFLVRVGELVFPGATIQVDTPPPAVPPRTTGEAVAMTEPVAEQPATADSELTNLLLKVVGEAGPGVPVSIAELRLQMPLEYRDKAHFDRALWHLVEGERLHLSRHNYPASLTPEERESLLTDPQGEFYAYVIQPHG